MPDAGEDSERRAPGSINNDFAYPNTDSYRSFGRETTVTSQLQHGMIYSMSTVNGVKNASQMLNKRFQFNPSALQFTMSMVATDPTSTETPGGSTPAGYGVGAATTALSLAFNREIEVFRATAGNSNTPAYFKDLGVVKDILDLYRVILGEGNSSVVADQNATLEHLNGELFDLATTGRELTMRPVIVSFNRALTYYGTVTGMVYEFQKFNHKMVPTIASVTLNFDILNINSNRAIAAGVGTAAAASGSTSVPNSGSNTSSTPAPGALMPTTSGYYGTTASPFITAGGIRWGG